jgi:hypothetical protein
MSSTSNGAGEAGGGRDDSGLTPAQRAWRDHIRRCEEEGLTYKAYCQREGLKVGGLYAARKVLRGADSGGAVPTPPTSPPRFAAVRLAHADAPGTVEVLLTNGVQLRVSLASVEAIGRLVQELGRLER